MPSANQLFPGLLVNGTWNVPTPLTIVGDVDHESPDADRLFLAYVFQLQRYGFHRLTVSRRRTAQWHLLCPEPVEINIEFRTKNVEIPRNTNATSAFDILYSVFDIQISLEEDCIGREPMVS